MNDYRELHELYHFGILGMHWGVRRYQNPDGTLTAAGKARYDKLNAKSKDYTSKRDEIYKKGIDNIGIIDGMRSDYYYKKAESTKKEAKKYGTETAEERDSRLEASKKAHQEKIQNYINEAEDIHPDGLADRCLNTDVELQWEKALKKDQWDLDFLEITQNDYEEVPDKSRNKLLLRDYKDYLNAKTISKDVIDKHDKNFQKETNEAADLGLKAYQKIGWDRGEPGDPSEREWFIYEDQTIGDVEVAALCKKYFDKNDQNTKKAKKELSRVLESMDNNNFWEYFGKNDSMFDLDYYVSYNGYKDNKYIDALFAILESEGKIHQSAEDEIFENFGII